MKKLIRDIKKILVTESNSVHLKKGREMSEMNTIEDAFILIDGDKIVEIGPMSELKNIEVNEIISAKDAFVLPTWCDSHTHLVFASSRENEFIDKIRGVSYEEIARKGGGILNSAKKLQQCSEELLIKKALERLEEVKGFGTGAIEIKSGYGLTTKAEIKMLRCIQKLKEHSNLSIKATFLGAHALPLEFKNKRADYIKLIIDEMLPQIHEENLADYIDVFCEKVAFSVDESIEIMEAGKKYGLKAKIHVNQFNCLGGIKAAIDANALSVDHLEVITDEEIDLLTGSDTMATLLPSAPFFLNDAYPEARKMIDTGMAVALATDYNPGSSPSGKIPFVLTLACIKMKMTPEEAIHAATLNGAYAMELSDTLGSITVGKKANLIITKPMDSLAYMPYAFGTDWIDKVMIDGQ